VLRWLWEAAGKQESRMVLLMNLDTTGTVRNTSLTDSVLQEMCAILNDAWQAVVKAESRIGNISSFAISRSERGAFATPFSQLRSVVQGMTSPVMTARTGIVCPSMPEIHRQMINGV